MVTEKALKPSGQPYCQYNSMLIETTGTTTIHFQEYLRQVHLHAPGMADVECAQLQAEGTEKIKKD